MKSSQELHFISIFLHLYHPKMKKIPSIFYKIIYSKCFLRTFGYHVFYYFLLIGWKTKSLSTILYQDDIFFLAVRGFLVVYAYTQDFYIFQIFENKGIKKFTTDTSSVIILQNQ
jgi:hypothetical protein